MATQRRVLVVDDEAALRGLYAAELAERGYIVLEAANGTEALELARMHRPHVVLTDLHMPGMNGDELAKRLTSENLGASIYLATGAPTPELAQKVIDAGAQGLIQKTAGLNAILSLVASAFMQKGDYS